MSRREDTADIRASHALQRPDPAKADTESEIFGGTGCSHAACHTIYEDYEQWMKACPKDSRNPFGLPGATDSKVSIEVWINRLRLLATQFGQENVLSDIFAAIARESDWVLPKEERAKAALDLEYLIYLILRDFGGYEGDFRCGALDCSCKDRSTGTQGRIRKAGPPKDADDHEAETRRELSSDLPIKGKIQDRKVAQSVPRHTKKIPLHVDVCRLVECQCPHLSMVLSTSANHKKDQLV